VSKAIQPTSTIKEEMMEKLNRVRRIVIYLFMIVGVKMNEITPTTGECQAECNEGAIKV
jgi:hypothetical protein